ncbi:hypothetical protein PsYK624_131480 [Phanerochaete sordida]|uniref:Uncharacterized protein n=1 Tax=Phanerochaete sordida TaxID=48140 RepID=A0A9P3LJR1_9APHY|nr:hypothetical protein PsYK624_131480 [Phanerochaete sordida]
MTRQNSRARVWPVDLTGRTAPMLAKVVAEELPCCWLRLAPRTKRSGATRNLTWTARSSVIAARRLPLPHVVTTLETCGNLGFSFGLVVAKISGGSIAPSDQRAEITEARFISSALMSVETLRNPNRARAREVPYGDSCSHWYF